MIGYWILDTGYWYSVIINLLVKFSLYSECTIIFLLVLFYVTGGINCLTVHSLTTKEA